MNEIEIIESIPTKIKYKGTIWVPEETNKSNVDNINNVNKVNNINKIDKVDKNFTTPTEKPIKHGNIKKPYIVKWIEDKNPKTVFTLDQFYRVYPKLKKNSVGRKRIDKIITGMVTDNKLIQLPGGKFMVA